MKNASTPTSLDSKIYFTGSNPVQTKTPIVELLRCDLRVVLIFLIKKGYI